MKLQLGLLVFIALLAELALAQSQPAGDIPAEFKPPTDARNYEKREEMIPMRDGVKLYTVIVMPKGATNAPIVLTRTPYNAASARQAHRQPAHVVDPAARRRGVRQGRLYPRLSGHPRQIWLGGRLCRRRGPVIGPLNPTKVDHVTDA